MNLLALRSTYPQENQETDLRLSSKLRTSKVLPKWARAERLRLSIFGPAYLETGRAGHT
jgi:hypothetical protein